MTLTEFLLARIAEVEDMARGALPYVAAPGAQIEIWLTRREGDESWSKMIRPYDPAHVLAECEAKRQAIECAWGDHLQIEGEWGRGRGQDDLEEVDDYPGVVKCLAIPYADHADYRAEWAL